MGGGEGEPPYAVRAGHLVGNDRCASMGGFKRDPTAIGRDARELVLARRQLRGAVATLQWEQRRMALLTPRAGRG